ncbi:hypothetical protein [Chelativorans sp.]|uniref:hypothetical protein n=1 Tax=Chelativorans sp. TaxID=2203393 RepID=UPI002811D3AF|nr:hypothetical protein [Chelativorans sp.]
MASIESVVGPFLLTGRLLVRFWPQLLLVGAVGYLLRDLLLRAAATVGLVHPLGGMVILSLVVLVKLAVVVMLFLVMRPGLPALASLSQPEPSVQTKHASARGGRMLAITAAAILPFFAYYAAWGFLGDTVREYSRLALDQVQFGEEARFLDLLTSRGLLLSIAACWAIRWLAKRMNKRSRSPYWRLLVVAADASWIFIGLYGLSIWKDAFITWLGAGELLDSAGASGGALLVSVAHAAESFTPVEFQPPDWPAQMQSLFFYALLPIVWLVMAAIINGYELSGAGRQSVPAASPAGTLRKWLADFTDHFVSGYRARYRPVWICLKLTLGSGLVTLLSFIVAYRLIGWMGAWAWYALTRMLAPQDLVTWQAIFGVAGVFIGSPSDLDGGILLDALRVALLAGMLEHAVARRGAAPAMV